MKCDELKFERLGDANETYPASTLVIRKQFVVAAISELKREHHKERHEYIDMVAQHKAKLVEQESENRKLKRALWLAMAKRALEKIAWFKLWNASISTMNPEDGARQEFDKWKKALGKLLKKAEEYK